MARPNQYNLPMRKRGYVHVYTGDGKGKTTAAFGLALRTLGHGGRVFVVQFMKKGKTGEARALSAFGDSVRVIQTGPSGFLGPDNRGRFLRAARSGFETLRDALCSGEYDLVIGDELAVAVGLGLIPVEEVLELVSERPAGTELVITGRCAPRELIEAADLVTEMREIKHYYKKGVKARRGIEF
ncbi:MAG: cob(I)yrinic acid a,c-diamide adenosyltransferase [candidate division WOR-3 bacterium]